MAEVELRKVVKRYGATLVVHGVDLHIRDSEFVVLVGPSGCGKSTVLRMIAGLEKVSDGEILISGQVVNNVSPKDRDVAMVFQNYALYPHMTVRENMGFSLKMAKRSRGDTAAAVDKAAAVLELNALLDRKPSELSGGQRQRVAMGRAIVRQPSVFLFDEPLSNLDAQLRMQMRIELRKMHMRLQTTTIYVTHDQIEAMTLADKIVILKDGYIHQVGTPVEVFEQPANVFVAQFIGNPPMNILSGNLVEQNNALCFVRGETALPLTQGKWKNISPGQQVLLGIRPDAVKLGHALQDIPEEWRTRGKVVISEVLGAHSLLTFLHEGANIIAEVEGRLDVHEDDAMDIGFDLQRASLFDPETTNSIA